MSRFHVHLAVADLDAAISFYSALFGQIPARREADYAKWMLESPRVNFAVSTGAGPAGVTHLGVQAETADEFAEWSARAEAASPVVTETQAQCCYAVSDKTWAHDPAGLPWEMFLTAQDVRATPAQAAPALRAMPAPPCCA